MATDHRRLDALRGSSSELENHYIDELVAGRVSRRDFMRKGAVIGMSTTMMGAILAACGGANNVGTSSASGSASGSTSGTPTKGGNLRLATQAPAAAVNPLTVSDAGGLCMLAQTGEFLAFDDNQALQLKPMLATAWKPSNNGSVWTFSLRQGVKFHDGSPLTADDVVYTIQQLADPKNASNALSTFTDVLKPDGVQKVDANTVAFHLEAPNGNFPYLVSSDNYNAHHRAQGHDFGKWQKSFIGTGPFKLKSYTQNVGANFVANAPTGAARRTSTRPRSPSTRLSSRRSWPSRAALSTSLVQFVTAGRSVPPQQLAVHDHQPQIGQPPRAVDAQRHGAVHRPACPPGDRALAGPSRHDQRPAGR